MRYDVRVVNNPDQPGELGVVLGDYESGKPVILTCDKKGCVTILPLPENSSSSVQVGIVGKTIRTSSGKDGVTYTAHLGIVLSLRDNAEQKLVVLFEGPGVVDFNQADTHDDLTEIGVQIVSVKPHDRIHDPTIINRAS